MIDHMKPLSPERTADLAGKIHELTGLVGGADLSDAEQGLLLEVEQYLFDQQAEIDQLRAERANCLAPQDPDADRACPHCGSIQLEGKGGRAMCGTCYATGPDENNPNGFEGDWNTRAVPPGAALAEQLRRLVIACEKPRGRVAEMAAARDLLEKYDAVAASGRAPRPRDDAAGEPRSLFVSLDRRK